MKRILLPLGLLFGQPLLADRAAGVDRLKADEARHVVAIGAKCVRAGALFVRQHREPLFAKCVCPFAHLLDGDVGLLGVGDECRQALVGQRMVQQCLEDAGRHGADIGAGQKRLAHMAHAAD